MQMTLFDIDAGYDSAKRSKISRAGNRSRRSNSATQLRLFAASAKDLWSELRESVMDEDLRVPLATTAVSVGVARAVEVGRMLKLPRNWATSEMVISIVIDQHRGQSIGNVADACGLNKKLMLSVAKRLKIRYRNRRPQNSEVKRAMQLVLADGRSIREAARQSSISRSALHRYLMHKRNRIASTAGKMEVKQVKQWRCPEHGPITVYPCVACAAAAARKR